MGVRRGGAGAAARPAAAAAAAVRRRRTALAAAAAAADSPAANDAAAAEGDGAAGDGGAVASGAAAAPAPGSSGKKSPNFLLSDSLLNISIAIIGDDTQLNWAVAQALAKRIGWFPVSTSKVLCGMHKAQTLQELVAREGAEAVAAHEADMLRGMRDQRRCCVATLGSGASALPAVYDSLNASLIIWLDEQDRRAPKPDTPARALWRAAAEVPTRIDAKTGFAARTSTPEDKAKQVVGPLVKGLLDLLKQDPALPGRKLLYAEMGYRGDWPELQPPNWNPVLDRMGAGPGAAAPGGGGGREGEPGGAAAV